MENVMILTGAGQIGMAIARRIGYGMKIVVGDRNVDNAGNIRDTLHAYQMATRCNVKRVMAEAVKWAAAVPSSRALIF